MASAQAAVKTTAQTEMPEGRGSNFRPHRRHQRIFRYNPTETRRDGRAAEGGGLLNRYRVKSSIGGSNPPLSARNLP